MLNERKKDSYVITAFSRSEYGFVLGVTHNVAKPKSNAPTKYDYLFTEGTEQPIRQVSTAGTFDSHWSPSTYRDVQGELPWLNNKFAGLVGALIKGKNVDVAPGVTLPTVTELRAVQDVHNRHALGVFYPNGNRLLERLSHERFTQSHAPAIPRVTPVVTPPVGR